MNKFLLKLLILSIFSAFLFLIQGSTYAAASSEEKIDSFNSNVTIHPDSSLSVIESITYDFGTTQRHGIYRDIQYLFPDKKVDIDVVMVEMDDSAVEFTTQKNGNYLRIKIGSADQYVTGGHDYKISYSIRGAFNYLNQKDELYWQVTGTSWEVPIKFAQVEVGLSLLSLQAQDISAYCYSGNTESTQKCDSAASQGGNYVFSQKNLSAGEGLTYAIGLPAGSVERVIINKSFSESFLNGTTNWKIASIAMAIYLISTVIASFYVGRYALKRTVIVPEYDPPKDMTPLEVGVLYDSRIDAKDISAEIIYFATRGYLKIKRIENAIFGIKSTDYELQKTNEIPPDPQKPYDKKIFDIIFCSGDQIKISELQSQIQKTRSSLFFSFSKQNWEQAKNLNLSAIHKEIYQKLEERGFLQNHSSAKRNFSSIPMIPVAFILFFFASNYFAFFLLGMIVFELVLRYLAKPLTKLGAEYRNYIKGLKLYINTAEKDRINFHNDPAKSPERFEALLPYAMVFGLERKWAQEFEGIYNQNPSWYDDPRGNIFSATVFAGNITSFEKSLNSGFSTGASGSGGGGSVGGGGGGGGGGSW